MWDWIAQYKQQRDIHHDTGVVVEDRGGGWYRVYERHNHQPDAPLKAAGTYRRKELEAETAKLRATRVTIIVPPLGKRGDKRSKDFRASWAIR